MKTTKGKLLFALATAILALLLLLLRRPVMFGGSGQDSTASQTARKLIPGTNPSGKTHPTKEPAALSKWRRDREEARHRGSSQAEITSYALLFQNPDTNQPDVIKYSIEARPKDLVFTGRIDLGEGQSGFVMLDATINSEGRIQISPKLVATKGISSVLEGMPAVGNGIIAARYADSFTKQLESSDSYYILTMPSITASKELGKIDSDFGLGSLLSVIPVLNDSGTITIDLTIYPAGLASLAKAVREQAK